MNQFRRAHGFWAAVGALKLREIFSAELISGTVIGAVISWFQIVNGSLESRTDVVANFLLVVPALLGIVFAGFALLVAFLSLDYMRFLNSSGSGVKAFFRPFMIAIGFQVGLIVLSTLVLAIGAFIPSVLEQALFTVASLLFGCAVLEIIALARSVLMQSSVRARFEEVTNTPEATVTDLKKRTP